MLRSLSHFKSVLNVSLGYAWNEHSESKKSEIACFVLHCYIKPLQQLYLCVCFFNIFGKYFSYLLSHSHPQTSNYVYIQDWIPSPTAPSLLSPQHIRAIRAIGLSIAILVQNYIAREGVWEKEEAEEGRSWRGRQRKRRRSWCGGGGVKREKQEGWREGEW